MKEDDELHWSVKHKSGALRAPTVAGDPGRLPYCRLLGGVNLLKDFGRGGYTLLLGRFLEEWLKKKYARSQPTSGLQCHYCIWKTWP